MPFPTTCNRFNELELPTECTGGHAGPFVTWGEVCERSKAINWMQGLRGKRPPLTRKRVKANIHEQNIKMLNKGYATISIHIGAEGKMETPILVHDTVVTTGNAHDPEIR